MTLNTRFIDKNVPLSPVHEKLAKVQEGENVMCSFITRRNNSRHSITCISMKELFNAMDKQFVSILCKAVINAATRGKIRTPSDLDQLLSMEDHKLDRLSPLLPVLPGFPVHITQNVAPNLDWVTDPQEHLSAINFHRIHF